jgi:hypothetical protein
MVDEAASTGIMVGFIICGLINIVGIFVTCKGFTNKTMFEVRHHTDACLKKPADFSLAGNSAGLARALRQRGRDAR